MAAKMPPMRKFCAAPDEGDREMSQLSWPPCNSLVEDDELVPTTTGEVAA